MTDCNETLIPMIHAKITKDHGRTMVNSTEYRSLIGCLRYLLHTRPDLSYSVGLLSRFMQEPREQHMKAIRQVLRYVKGTKDYGNHLHNITDWKVNKITWIQDQLVRKSTLKKAKVHCSNQHSSNTALWLKRLLSKLTHSQEEKVTIQVDNKSAIALMKNPVFHGRSKHIDTKYHFIRECIEREDIQVKFVNGEYQKADILTKALPRIKFLTMRQLIGLKNLRSNFNVSEMISTKNNILKKQILEKATSVAVTNYAKPGCNDTCGKVRIPYPFGIGANCSVNKWYTIDCNSSTPYLSALNHLEVLGVDLENQTITVNMQKLSVCSQTTKSVDLGSSPFLYSKS
ncbi:ribonuclease H-like domain, reverse transcriptase, RNA-dependent DNA polymerase [Tanacetum coccineum]